MKLFRPTGLHELQLVLSRDLVAWPPRLPGQPIFYPVLSAEYAAQIARDWNARSDTLAGYVTTFDIEDAFTSRFERHLVGNRAHEELWVPSEELEEFNRHIVGLIRVVGAYFGDGFTGVIPSGGKLRGLDARRQFNVLAGMVSSELQDLPREVVMNRDAIFLHLQFWRGDTVQPDVTVAKQDILNAITRGWTSAFPRLPLP